LRAITRLSYNVDMSRRMDVSKTVAALTALAQPTRLAAFRRLLAAYPEVVAAGALAQHCRVPHNTMSTHLSTLVRARLVAVRRDGRSMNYRADLDGFRALVTFLTRDCCDGRPEICAPMLADLVAPCCPPASAPRKRRAANAQ
jgi:ArsR family transcriptional regulator, arsenate/arsenite/antimonite-responsive transcriptional repressor